MTDRPPLPCGGPRELGARAMPANCLTCRRHEPGPMVGPRLIPHVTWRVVPGPRTGSGIDVMLCDDYIERWRWTDEGHAEAWTGQERRVTPNLPVEDATVRVAWRAGLLLVTIIISLVGAMALVAG